MILTPGPVINFLLANQNAKEPRFIDWMKVDSFLITYVIIVFLILITLQLQITGKENVEKYEGEGEAQQHGIQDHRFK